jgi:hypothetical protein
MKTRLRLAVSIITLFGASAALAGPGGTSCPKLQGEWKNDVRDITYRFEQDSNQRITWAQSIRSAPESHVTFTADGNPQTNLDAPESRVRMTPSCANGVLTILSTVDFGEHPVSTEHRFSVDGGVLTLDIKGANPDQIRMNKVIKKRD